MDATYWRGAAEDEAMQDEHGFIWEAILDTISSGWEGTRVLDAGCNRGGFLRLLADRAGIAEGCGYDPASGAISDARALTDGRPLRFEVSDTVPAGWDGFDAAFSHEVLYLLRDMPAHAAAVFSALKAGASYYAVMGVHSGSPLAARWHAGNATRLGLPPLCDVDDVVAVFRAAGFEVAAARLRLGFVPAEAHRSDAEQETFLDWLRYYHEHKLLLRFTRPGG